MLLDSYTLVPCSLWNIVRKRMTLFVAYSVFNKFSLLLKVEISSNIRSLVMEVKVTDRWSDCLSVNVIYIPAVDLSFHDFWKYFTACYFQLVDEMWKTEALKRNLVKMPIKDCNELSLLYACSLPILFLEMGWSFMCYWKAKHRFREELQRVPHI